MPHIQYTHTTLFFVVKVVCPDVSIRNGDVTISPADRGLMSRTVYDCYPGYALKGNGNRVCQIDDTWNGTDPECGEWFIFQTNYSYHTLDLHSQSLTVSDIGYQEVTTLLMLLKVAIDQYML